MKKSKEAAPISEQEFADSLSARVAEFQKSGGKVQEIEIGHSALTDKPVSKQFTISSKKTTAQS